MLSPYSRGNAVLGFEVSLDHVREGEVILLSVQEEQVHDEHSGARELGSYESIVSERGVKSKDRKLLTLRC